MSSENGTSRRESPQLQRFRALMKARRYDEAAALAREEQETASPGSGFWLNLEASALTRGGKPDRGLKSARRALELEPGNPFARLAVGNALLALERPAEALELFLEAEKDERTRKRARGAVVECLEKLRRWQEVLSRIEQWGLTDRRASRLRALAELGRYAEAREQTAAWLEEDPGAKTAVWMQAELEERQEGLQAALERARRRSRIPSLSRIYTEVYASLLRKAGREEEAARVYSDLQGSGASIKIQKKQAFALARSGHEPEAVEMFEALLRADPRDNYVHNSYQAACGRLGDLERAIDFYNRLLSEHPEEKGLFGRMRKLRGKLERGGS